MHSDAAGVWHSFYIHSICILTLSRICVPFNEKFRVQKKRKAPLIEEVGEQANGVEEPVKKKKKKKDKDKTPAAEAANGGGEVLAAASTEIEGKKKVSPA